MPRLVYLAGVALLVLAWAFLLTDQLVWEPGMTEANIRRIRVGMRREQVETILSGPVGGPTESKMRFDLPAWYLSSEEERRASNPAPGRWVHWHSPGVDVWIVFDQYGRVWSVRR